MRNRREWPNRMGASVDHAGLEWDVIYPFQPGDQYLARGNAPGDTVYEVLFPDDYTLIQLYEEQKRPTETIQYRFIDEQWFSELCCCEEYEEEFLYQTYEEALKCLQLSQKSSH